MQPFKFEIPEIDHTPAAYTGRIRLGDEVLVLDDAQPCTLSLFTGQEAGQPVFAIVEENEYGEQVTHSLHQQAALPIYPEDTGDITAAAIDDVRPADRSSLYRKPRWLYPDAIWPMYQGHPFYFVKQFAAEHASFLGLMLFLFVYFQPGKPLLCMVIQHHGRVY